ncbi:MAG: hypothetical protein ACO233_05105, partial [Candidatus Fonsibacter ubiquis]
NGANKVVANATKLNANRKEAKRLEEEKKAKEQNMKNVAAELQQLTNLTKNNRTKYIEQLKTTNKATVLSQAKAENARRKTEAQKAKEQEMKNVAAKLQEYPTLLKNNRTKFMNRLATNGANKVLENAAKLHERRQEDRKGVEWKLKQIGVSGANFNNLMRNWNNARNKTVFNRARAIVAAKKQPLLNRINRNVDRANNFAQARIKWKNAIAGAKTDENIQKIQKLLNDKVKLRERTLETVKDLPAREQYPYTKNLTAYKNDVANRTKNLENLIAMKKKKLENEEAARVEAEKKAQFEETKKPIYNKIVAEIPGKWGAFRREWEGLVKKAQTKEELDAINTQLNEKIKLRNEVRASQISNKEKAGHEAWVMKHANDINKRRAELAGQLQKLKANANAKAKAEANAKAAANAKAKAEKDKQNKLRANTAKMLQGMTGLERANRKEFMARLNRGNDPAKVISNAQKKNAEKGFSFGNRTKPAITMAQRFNNNNKNNNANAKKEIEAMTGMGVKNRDRFVKRINSGENAATVLAEARARNKKGAAAKSKTVKKLEYNQAVKNVLRRL